MLRLLVLMFIGAAGITHPSLEAQGRAAFCLGSLVAAMILLLCALSSLALTFLHI
ncbi:MAG TPA: hypothetical protein VMU48_07515 [Terracidiphilus sp.]|nr:hypothetical protein [Terracidiphilus sp.]